MSPDIKHGIVARIAFDDSAMNSPDLQRARAGIHTHCQSSRERRHLPSYLILPPHHINVRTGGLGRLFSSTPFVPTAALTTWPQVLALQEVRTPSRSVCPVISLHLLSHLAPLALVASRRGTLCVRTHRGACT